METRRDLLLGVGALFGLNLLLAFTAIGLFGRMGPVIDRILRENVHSIEAAEEMLSALAASPAALIEPEERARFDAALARARSNVTEQPERTILGRLAATREGAFAGDESARRELVAAIRDLTAVNRQALARTDREARRLGQAGAWFSALLATFTLLLSAFTVRRLMLRLIAPVRELVTTFDDIRAGNVHRRASEHQSPKELVRIIREVNQMLDVRFMPRPLSEQKAKIDRAVALWAIERETDAIYVIDERGNIHAANGRGHRLLGSPHGASVRGVLPRAVGREAKKVTSAGDLEVEATPLGAQPTAWLCRVRAADVPD